MTKGSMGTRAVRARVPTGAGTLVVDVGVATIPAGASALTATDVPLPTLLPSTGPARSRFRHLGRAAWATLVAGMATSTGLATLPAAALPTLAHAATVSPGTAAIFVANEGAAGSTGSVTEYKVRDSGNVRPVLTISRGVNQPYGLAFDASGDLWVANNNSNTVVEYKKSELAKASPAPSVIISSSPDQALNGPSGLAFDSFGNLWVDNGGTNTVIEYTKAELSGSGSPAPRVNFTNAALFAAAGPAGLAVDPSGDLWVEGSPSGSGDAVCEYPKSQLAKPGPPAPRATISPGYQLWDFTFDSSGNLWVPEYYGSTVAEYTKAELTKSGSPPVHLTIAGPISLISTPSDLAFDSSGDLWVLSSGDNALVEYTKAELAKSGSPTPASIIKGAATGLNTPQYFAMEP